VANLEKGGQQMREVELKQVCGNCQWVVAQITEEPYCLFDGHVIKTDEERCNQYSFNVQIKHSLENIDAIEAEAKRQIQMMRMGMKRKDNYEIG